MHYSTQHFCVRISMMPREVSSRRINRFLQARTCRRALSRRLNVAGDVCCASFVPMRRLFDGRMLLIQLQLCSCINSIQLVASPPHGITFLLRPVQCSRVRVLLLSFSTPMYVADRNLSAAGIGPNYMGMRCQTSICTHGLILSAFENPTARNASGTVASVHLRRNLTADWTRGSL